VIHSSPIALAAVVAWVPVVLMLFVALRPRRAVLAAFIGSWLFLPVVGYQAPFLPDVTKMLVTSLAVLLGAAVFDSGRLLSFRPRWFDLPMLVWCLTPMASSLTNGLGAYDGTSAVVEQVIAWGLPYYIGRVYFNDLESLRELAIAIAIGGLLYVPLVMLEARISPQLHRFVYGYHQHSFAQTKRFGGYRPMVFMQHGLMVAFWMTSSTLTALVLDRAKAARSLLGLPTLFAWPAMALAALVCKSVNAWFGLAAGFGTVLANRTLRTSLPLLALVVAVPGYMALRTTGMWQGEGAVQLVGTVINEDRAASLQTRLDNESMLIDKALQRPAFGWGRWGRYRVFDEHGRDISVTDGLWIIALGQTGLVGLTALTATFLTPVLLFRRRFQPREWRLPAVAPAFVLALLLALYMVDSLLNAMVNPVYGIMAGGLIATRAAPRRDRRGATQRQHPKTTSRARAIPKTTPRDVTKARSEEALS